MTTVNLESQVQPRFQEPKAYMQVQSRGLVDRCMEQ